MRSPNIDKKYLGWRQSTNCLSCRFTAISQSLEGLLPTDRTYIVYRRAAHFVNKLIKGERASDLPVEQPVIFDLVINQNSQDTGHSDCPICADPRRRGDRMRRREFMVLLGGLAAAWPRMASAQARGPIRIGLLPFGSPSNDYDKSLVEAFRLGLRQAGLIEGRDIVLDIVWTSGSDADTDKAVAELIERGAALLVPTGSTASVATKRHTSTIPIVFVSVGNPVAMGLVENLAHPGGNATGFSDIFSDLSAKLVELGKAISKQDTIYYLWHTAWPDGKIAFKPPSRPPNQ